MKNHMLLILLAAGVLLMGCAPKTLDQLLAQSDRESAEGNLDKAYSAAYEVVKMDPNNSDAYRRLGQIQLKRGNVDAARDSLLNAVTINQNDYLAHFLLGLTYIKMGSSAGACQQEARLREIAEDQKLSGRVDPAIVAFADNLKQLLGTAAGRPSDMHRIHDAIRDRDFRHWTRY